MLLYGMEEEANVLDNSHTRGNLHRTRNQRLPAGRVLIRTHPVEIARRPTSRRAISFGKGPSHVLGLLVLFGIGVASLVGRNLAPEPKKNGVKEGGDDHDV